MSILNDIQCIIKIRPHIKQTVPLGLFAKLLRGPRPRSIVRVTLGVGKLNGAINC